MKVWLCEFLGVTVVEGLLTEVENYGNRCRYVAGSNRTQLLSPVSIRLPLASGPVEGGKMGGGGGHEQHTSSAPGLHGGRLTVTDTGIYTPQASHWEVWVWQGVSSQVERRLCPECGGQKDGGYGHYWAVLVAGGVCSGAGTTADGGRCGEKPWPNRERRWLVVIIFDYVYVSKVVTNVCKELILRGRLNARFHFDPACKHFSTQF